MVHDARRFRLLISILASSILAADLAAQQADYPDLQWATVPTDAGGTQPLKMNIWLPDSGAAHAPLVMWIHGGAWLAGTYDAPPPGLSTFLKNGYAVASIQYRLSTAAIFPAQIHDVKGAVRYLRAHADEYKIDASRFAAFGASAGGHLAALLGTSEGIAELEGNTGGNSGESSAVQTIIDFFGPTDILRMNLDVTSPPGSVINHDVANAPESQLIGFSGAGQGVGVLRANITSLVEPFREKVALAIAANPITHVDPKDPPMYIAHGDQDNVVPFKQSQRLADALKAQNIDYVLRTVIDAGHGFQSAEVDTEALEFLNKHLLQPARNSNRDGDGD